HVFVRSQITPTGHVPLIGRFMIDTGAATALVLNTPFIEINKLIPPTQGAIPLTGCGIGGDTAMLVSTVEGLRLGRFSILKPNTMFSRAAKGVLTSPEFDGLIGSAILRHYRVVFDYSRHRMILETSPKTELSNRRNLTNRWTQAGGSKSKDEGGRMKGESAEGALIRPVEIVRLISRGQL